MKIFVKEGGGLGEFLNTICDTLEEIATQYEFYANFINLNLMVFFMLASEQA